MRVYRCKMSVRALVESVWIGGDLVSTAPSIERANLGSRIHRMLQSSAQGDYESEVFLKLSSDWMISCLKLKAERMVFARRTIR